MEGFNLDEICKRGFQMWQEENKNKQVKEDEGRKNAARIFKQLCICKNSKATSEELFQALETISFILKEHNLTLPRNGGWENYGRVTSELTYACFMAQQTFGASTSAELQKVIETTPPSGTSTLKTTKYAMRIVRMLQEKRAYELIKRKK